MKKHPVSLAVVMLVIVATVGCFADASVSNMPEETRPPFEGKVFVTALTLPRPSSFTFVGDVAVHGASTESKDVVLNRLANIARNLGANAVVDLKYWDTHLIGTNHHAKGKAVIVDSRQLAVLNGEWR